MRIAKGLLVGALLACVVLPTGAASGSTGSLKQSPTNLASQQNGLRGEVTVSGAASLTESFTALGKAFRKRHPTVRIRFNFGSTSSLVAQIQNGAPVDVFASADIASQDRLSASGNIVSSPTVFARNTMQIAVKPGNPYAVRNVADLARVKVVALCGAAVPCGVYAATVLNLAKTTLPTTMITRGVDAKATLAAVTLGDADAAIVYATDVRQAGKQAQGVAIPAAQNVKAMYAISVVRGAANRAAAQAFVKFIVSAEGQTILRAFGFLAP